MELGFLYQRTKEALREAGIDTYALDARLLTQAACDVSAEDLLARPTLNFHPVQSMKLERFTARRLQGEPVSRILGRKEFWGLTFKVTPDTLDPRPDTETLVEATIAWAKQQPEPLRILDLGTGTGCILLSLLSELPGATGIGIDINEGALAVSRENAKRHDMAERAEFRQGDWFSALKSGESFDLIVSNPPYIAESEMKTLAIEVRNHDPRGALTDEKDGLEAYRVIYPQLKQWLKPGGRAFFEMGFAQFRDMQRLVENVNATLCNLHKDLAGHSRVVELSIANQAGIAEKKLEIPR